MKAVSGGSGLSVISVMAPFTRGSTTTLRPVMVAMVRATASMSALTKFRVTGSPRRGAAGLIAAGVDVVNGGAGSAGALAGATGTVGKGEGRPAGCACAKPASHSAQAATSQG